MAWLLDTNAWIGYLRNGSGALRRRLERCAPAEILTCSIVRAELLHGAMKYGVPERRVALVESTLAPFRSIPFDDAAARRYATLRHCLEQQGERIGPHDLLIAAICLENDVTLVSANIREFGRIPELRLEDWQGMED